MVVPLEAALRVAEIPKFHGSCILSARTPGYPAIVALLKERAWQPFALT